MGENFVYARQINSNENPEFGFFYPEEIPQRRLFGYDTQIKAGLNLCKLVSNGGSESLLVFGLPSTGRNIFPCVLATRFNSRIRKKSNRFSLCYIECRAINSLEEEEMVNFLSRLSDFIMEDKPKILHVCSTDFLGYSSGLGNGYELFEKHNLLTKGLRTIFSKLPKKTFLISTAEEPHELDRFFLSRFHNMFYFEPTSQEVTNQIIKVLLDRKDSNKIVNNLFEYIKDIRIILLSGVLIKACRLIKQKYDSISEFSPEEVALLLRNALKPNYYSALVNIKNYENSNEDLIKYSGIQLKFWNRK